MLNSETLILGLVGTNYILENYTSKLFILVSEIIIGFNLWQLV